MTHEERIEFAFLRRLVKEHPESSRVPLRTLFEWVVDDVGFADFVRQSWRMVFGRPDQVPDILLRMADEGSVSFDPRPGRGVTILPDGFARFDALSKAGA